MQPIFTDTSYDLPLQLEAPTTDSNGLGIMNYILITIEHQLRLAIGRKLESHENRTDVMDKGWPAPDLYPVSHVSCSCKTFSELLFPNEY